MENINNTLPREIAPGISGYYVHGEKHTLGPRGNKERQRNTSASSHARADNVYPAGVTDMTIDNKKYSLTEVMYHVVYANVPHNAVAITDCVMIDTFCQVSEEYKTG